MSASLNTIQPIDYPESDDELAHAAMVAERDALQERVKELENDLANARRDITYLNAKMEKSPMKNQQKITLVVPRDWNDGPGDTGRTIQRLLTVLGLHSEVRYIYPLGIDEVDVYLDDVATSAIVGDVRIMNGEIEPWKSFAEWGKPPQ